MNDPLPDGPQRDAPQSDETQQDALPSSEPLTNEPKLDLPQGEESQDELVEDFAIDDLKLDELAIDELAIDELEPDEDVDEFADELSAPAAVIEDPLSDADEPAAPAVGFYDAGPDLHALDDLTLVGRPGVLERLGPAHFRSKGFSFMGFLQTVYDHVAGELNGDPRRDA